MSTHERPLGIRPEISLSEKQVRALAALQAYDLTPVRTRLVDRSVMSAAWVDEAIFEFRRFLGLRIIRPGHRYMFSKHVDEVWHACLLFSRLYADFCLQVFGEFIHHEPALEAIPDLDTLFSEFQQLYEMIYGDFGRLWRMSPAHQCG